MFGFNPENKTTLRIGLHYKAFYRFIKAIFGYSRRLKQWRLKSMEN